MDPLQVAETLSKNSDDYRFMVAVVLMGMFGAAVVRWLVGQKDKAAKQHTAERKSWQENMESLCRSQQEQTLKLTVLLTRNIACIEENTRVLAQVLNLKR